MIAPATAYVLFIITTMGTTLGPVEIWQRVHTFTGPDAMALCVRNGMRIADRRNAESGRRHGPYRAHCEHLEIEAAP